MWHFLCIKYQLKVCCQELCIMYQLKVCCRELLYMVSGHDIQLKQSNNDNPALQTKNWFKVAICNEFFSIDQYKLAANRSESRDMGSLLDAENPCSHFEWHWVSQCLMHSFNFFFLELVISLWQGLNSWHENLTSTVLEHLKSSQGSGLGHICWLVGSWAWL